MKNAPLYALIAALVLIAIFFIWGFAAYFASGEGQGMEPGFVCGVIIFVVALVIFELSFKRAIIFPLTREEEE